MARMPTTSPKQTICPFPPGREGGIPSKRRAAILESELFSQRIYMIFAERKYMSRGSVSSQVTLFLQPPANDRDSVLNRSGSRWTWGDGICKLLTSMTTPQNLSRRFFQAATSLLLLVG